MDLITCGKCGKIHERSFRCINKRTYTRTAENKLRSTYKWTKKAKQIKNDAMGLCEVCKAQGVYNYNDLEVHHIEKLKDNPDGLLNDDNLICLCTFHHKQADAGELNADYLRELVKERR